MRIASATKVGGQWVVKVLDGGKVRIFNGKTLGQVLAFLRMERKANGR